MKNISLNQFVFCDDTNKTGTVFNKINCKYWGLQSGDNQYGCKQFCSLKNENIKMQTCFSCKERDPLIEIKTEQPKTPAEELRNKLPQFNFYSKTNQTGDSMSFADKAKTYVTAEKSQFLQGKVSQEVFDKRKEQCMSCHVRKNANPNVDKIGWCGGCGCSTSNPRAGLSQKLWMPSLSCPLNKFGKETGEGFKIKDATDVVSGVIQSVTDLLKPNGNQS